MNTVHDLAELDRLEHDLRAFVPRFTGAVEAARRLEEIEFPGADYVGVELESTLEDCPCDGAVTGMLAALEELRLAR